MLRHPAIPVAVLLAGAGLTDLAAAPALPGTKATGVFVLDDCDPDYQGKAEYRDNLSYIDGTGRLVFRVGGLNTCQMIGCNRQIAYDAARGHVWMAESVGKQVRKYDLAGKELAVARDVNPTAIALDPATGNVWVLRSDRGIDNGDVVVLDPNGKQLAMHAGTGFDIAYDRKAKAFWLAGKSLTKLAAADGKRLVQREIAAWSASSLAVHHATGRVWVAERRHPQVAGSANRLLAFDPDGKELHSIDLDKWSPFQVTVDQRSGAAWVAAGGRLVQFDPEGARKLERDVGVRAARVDPGTGDLWVVTKDEVLRMTPTGQVTKRVPHAAESLQVWIGGPE